MDLQLHVHPFEWGGGRSTGPTGPFLCCIPTALGWKVRGSGAGPGATPMTVGVAMANHGAVWAAGMLSTTHRIAMAGWAESTADRAELAVRTLPANHRAALAVRTLLATDGAALASWAESTTHRAALAIGTCAC